ncbi:hypothetical protein [Flexivirga alba]|uniref:Uncharacterized protein n=1 Tax=Flexivirga alba TaxID=702742 RepID=A0ABW2AMI9_9MICO
MLSSVRVRGGALAASAAVLLSGVVAAPASAAGADDIPIAGTFVYNGYNDPSNGDIHGAINAVVRVPGGTAVYYSIGGKEPARARSCRASVSGRHTRWAPLGR